MGGFNFTANARVELDAKKILEAHRLGKDGDAQKFFTHEVRRLSDPYVPFLTGTLKNSATETENTITYNTPYAKVQWYTNKGNGIRGKQWCLRMWADRRGEIISSVANYIGGKAE